MQLKATAEQIVEHPWMGGKKGAANLIHSESAWLGANTYDKLRTEMAVETRNTKHGIDQECV